MNEDDKLAALEQAERKQRDELESLLDELRALVDAAPAETVIAESDVEALSAFGTADTAPGLGFAPVSVSPSDCRPLTRTSVSVSPSDCRPLTRTSVSVSPSDCRPLTRTSVPTSSNLDGSHWRVKG